MTDDLKKKKADGKRIALTQPHEMAYIRKIANGVLKAPVLNCRTGQGDYVIISGLEVKLKKGNVLKYSSESIKRLAKAFLKLSKKRRKSKV